MTAITVLKFGGSVLREENDLQRSVHEIYRHWRGGSQVVAVVSAFGGETDALIARSRLFGKDPNPLAVASLLSTGEATSAALLALALGRSGIPSKILSPERLGLRTRGATLDGEPVAVNIDLLRDELEHAVVIVSGFVGIDGSGDPSLLGRGGTDYTALFLAHRLNAKCVLLKDVGSLYESDPAKGDQHTRRYSHACYETTQRTGGKLVQEKRFDLPKSGISSLRSGRSARMTRHWSARTRTFW
jgi:homoserine dehydrogenase